MKRTGARSCEESVFLGGLPARPCEISHGLRIITRALPQTIHDDMRMPKVGQIFVATNFVAFDDFLVNANWISGWLQSKHISSQDARREYVRCARNLRTNLSNLDLVEREEDQHNVVQHKKIVTEALTSELCSFRDVPLTKALLQQFEAIRSRYKLLV